MAQFQPNTVEEFKAVWGYMTPQEQQHYLDNGTVTTKFHTTLNQESFGDAYSAVFNVRTVYVFGNSSDKANAIATKHDFIRVEGFTPETVRQMMFYGFLLDGRIPTAVAEANGGQLPDELIALMSGQ